MDPSRYPAMIDEILATIDQEGLARIDEEFSASAETAVQHYRTWNGTGYFDARRSIRRSLETYNTILPQRYARILDIGAAFGWFAKVARFAGKHEVICADVTSGHTGGDKPTPECEAMLTAVNQLLGNTRVTMEPIRAGKPVVFHEPIGQFDLIVLDGTVFDRGWSAGDYAGLWRALRPHLAPKGRIWSRSNVSPFGVRPTSGTVIVTAGTEAYRPVIMRQLHHASILGVQSVIFDLGGLGMGQRWDVKDANFLREGVYWRDGGWPTKAIHKPGILLDLITQRPSDESHYVYLDADAIPLDRLDLPHQDFDVGVTWRPHAERKPEGHPYHTYLGCVNAGVVFFRGAARPFLEEWTRRTLLARNDQYALNSMIGDKLRVGEVREVEGVKVRCFGPEWNQTFAAKDTPLELTTRIVHFKSQSWDKYAAFPAAPCIILPEWDRRELVRRLPKGRIGCEIGVLQGRFSAQLLEGAEPELLHLVDAWAPVDGNLDESRVGGKEDHNANYVAAIKRVKEHVRRGRVKIHLGFTTEVLPTFPDHSFDWVYLDANHTYEGVKQDLELILPKMKPGGIIAGHDYDDTTVWANRIRCGVVQAVTEFCKEHDWHLKWVFADAFRNPSFWLEQP